MFNNVFSLPLKTFPQGTWWILSSGQLRDGSALDDTFNETFISDLGQIKIVNYERTLSLFLDLGAVSEEALTVLKSMLAHSLSHTEFQLSFGPTLAAVEHYSSHGGCINRLNELQFSRHRAAPD